MVRSFVGFALAFLLATVAGAQGWRAAYETGLRHAKEGKWAEAREAFKAATADRPEDVSGATGIPGPATEQRTWRDGSPYSPNFLAAYSAYKQGTAAGGDEGTALLRTAAGELEGLIARSQYSRETFFFLDLIYARLNDSTARQKVEATAQSVITGMNWRVDTEAIAAQERAEIADRYRNLSTMPLIKAGGTTPIINPGTIGQPINPDKPILAPPIGKVPVMDSKFALVIGNSETKLGEVGVPFAVENTTVVREALLQNGGYAEDHITVLTNATAEQIMAAAQALAERVKEKDTIFIYFSGVGVNIDGKDYLAGTNTTMATDSSSMVSKLDIFKPFMVKGAHVFAFFEVNRPLTNGVFFGMEVPIAGVSAQTYATLRGEQVYSTVRDGKTIGQFSEGLAETLEDLKSNRIPITEFGWQLFYKMRKGGVGQAGGSGKQTPTLPMLSNMASNTRF